MRRIFIALIAGGLLLVSGVAASAKLDSASAQQGQHGQQQQQADKTPAAKPAAKPAAGSTTPPTTTPAKPATKPATVASPTTCTAQAQQTGEFQGEHQDADCNAQDGPNAQSGAADATDTSEKTGNNED
jgi:hypothetical protein